jgi:hypothetical protein
MCAGGMAFRGRASRLAVFPEEPLWLPVFDEGNGESLYVSARRSKYHYLLRSTGSGWTAATPAPGVDFELPPPRSAVYMVQSRLDETALESLSTALKGVTVNLVFEEAPEEVAQREEPLPSTAPTAVLWWSQPPAAWTWWTSVPVVVEPAR